LWGYLYPLGVPLFDDSSLLIWQELGNLGDIRHKLHEIWIEGVGFVGASDEQHPETCISPRRFTSSPISCTLVVSTME
jgi:hypothetical protein